MIRAFIAIEVPTSAKDLMLRAQSTFRKLDDSKITWVRPEGVHLTLKFLGDVDEKAIPAISDTLSGCCKTFASIQITTTVTGAFPNINRPRIFWLGVSGGEELIRLQENIEVEMSRLGFPTEKGKFHPHLTLGRVKFISKQSRIMEAVAEYRFAEIGWTAERVLLMSSTLKSTGAEYKALAELRFKEKYNQQ